MTQEHEPTHAEIEATQGCVVLEFGTTWCGYCKAAQPLIARVLTLHPEIHHIRIEDGKGRRLGRLYKVTRWPTLIYLKNGKEVARRVRPMNDDEIDSLFRN